MIIELADDCARIASTREYETYLHISTFKQYSYTRKQQNVLGTKRMIQYSEQRNKYCTGGTSLTLTGIPVE